MDWAMKMNMKMAATVVMVGNCLAATVVTVGNGLAAMMVILPLSEHGIDLLVVAKSSTMVPRALDFHAMDLHLEVMVKHAMVAIHQRIDQPTNSIAIDLEQGHVRRVYCVPKLCLLQ